MQPQPDAVLVYTTFPNVEAAEAVGRAMVERRLAACANVIPGMVSIYEWKGAIQREAEAVMILKTSHERQAALVSAIRTAHPYETPAVIVLAVEGGDPDFLRWISAQTG